MMSITRADGLLEVTLERDRHMSIQMTGITGVTLSAEKLPCGRMAHALHLISNCESSPVRLDGSLVELSALHQYVLETMLDTNLDCPVGTARVH